MKNPADLAPLTKAQWQDYITLAGQIEHTPAELKRLEYYAWKNSAPQSADSTASRERADVAAA